MIRRLAILSLAVSVSIGSACTGITSTPIREILEKPRDFDGKVVVVSGTVGTSANVIVLRYYTVNDGTGEITVITERPVPKSGDKVRVKGRVQQAFSLLGKSIIVLHETAE